VHQANALIFDMDGLLIDSEPLWWRVEIALADDHGKRWTTEMAQQCVGTGLPNTIRVIKRELNIDIEVADGVAYLVDTFIKRIDELELKPGATALLEAARGKRKLALATSSTQRLMRAVLDRFSSVAPAFEQLITGDDVEHTKPAPDIFLLAAERLGVDPAQCVVLEDSVAGAEAGRAAGMFVIAVPEHAPERFESLTPHVVVDLHQARELLGL
jgi:HAD superfamily hydrolase (TIGR01509 family)